MAVSDFVRGAVGGYEFVDDKFRQRDQDNERRVAIRTDEQRYQDTRERQSRLDAEAREGSAFNRDQILRQNAIADENLSLNRESHQFNREQTRRQTAIADENLRVTRDTHRFNQERVAESDRQAKSERERAELKEQAVFIAQRAMAGGEPFPKELHDRLVESGMSYLSFYDGIERPEVHQAAMSLAPVLEQVRSGNIDVINSPQAIDAINLLYEEEIKHGVGEFNQAKEAVIVDKRIVELSPSPVPGKFGVILEVTLDNGEKYLAPRTRETSSSPEDPVRLIDAGVALDDLMGRYQLAQLRELSRESISNQYRAIYGALPGEQKGETQKFEFRQIDGGVNELTGERTAPIAGRFNPQSGEFEPFEETVQSPASSTDPFNGDPEDVVLQALKQANPNTPEEELLEYIRSIRPVQN